MKVSGFIAFISLAAVPAFSATVALYTEGFSQAGGGAYAYPSDKAKVAETAVAHSGKKGLQLNLVGGQWSGAGIYRAPLDLRGALAKGVIEFWIKGAKGGETLNIGMVNKANGAATRLPLAGYLPGGVKTSWQKVVLPLKDLPKTANMWDAAASKNVEYPADWSKAAEISIDNNGAAEPYTLFVDDVSFKDRP